MKQKQIRHTHATAAALEDALAVAIDIINEQARAAVYIDARTRKLMEILKQARPGPNAYQPERPAGLRVTITTKR